MRGERKQEKRARLPIFGQSGPGSMTGLTLTAPHGVCMNKCMAPRNLLRFLAAFVLLWSVAGCDPKPTTPGTPFLQGDLPGGGAVGVWRSGGRLTDAAVVWPDLSVVYIQCNGRYLNVDLEWNAPASGHCGLLGSNDGNPANDLTDREGKVCAADDAPGISAFVESWRVTDAESLFTYAPGESTGSTTTVRRRWSILRGRST